MKNKLLLLLITMLLSWYSLAQDSQDQSVATDEPQTTLEDPAGADAAEQTESDEITEDEEEDAPGRFIPSEQISQDLGVSFPIDI